MNEGKIISIRGVVVDVEFKENETPQIYEALIVKNKDESNLILEVQAVLNTGLVRAVAMGDVFGLSRGMKVQNTGKPIQVPVGKETLGRIFNVLGEAIDKQAQPKTKKMMPIHRTPPKLSEQSVKQEVFETGIKVIDLIAPFIKGGKVAVFGGAGVGKTVTIQELIHNV